MAKRGYIYKGLKPVNWSPSSESALAEAEIEYQDKRSASIYVAFGVKDGKGVLENGERIIIWTTTPWTIPANLGISVHPDLEYSVIAVGEDRFVVASALVENVASACGFDQYEVTRTVKGKDLENIIAEHPLYGRDSLVMLGEHVTTDAGTGCVHTAPGHGEDDFIIGQKYGLDVLCPVDEKGVMTSEAPGFEGMFYDDANKAITQQLDEKGALVKLEFITHSYPHDWRTKKPTIFRATAQWFASIKDFRSDLLDAIKETKWVPEWGEQAVCTTWFGTAETGVFPDSVRGVCRFRYFTLKTENRLLQMKPLNMFLNCSDSTDQTFGLKKKQRIFFRKALRILAYPNGTFTKEQDIMDVWFDSGSSHQAVLEERDDLVRPADLYLEGSDQYRGWFNSSLSTAVAVTGKAPYKGVLSHGFALDGEGRKMSKSIGNVVVPAKVMKQLGADILRLWVSSVDYQADVRVSDAILKQVAEVYRKIRNTFRFLHGNLFDFDPKTNAVAVEDLREVDQYMLIKLKKLIDKVKKAYDEYEFAVVYHSIHNFCTIELSSFYLDFAKDIVYIEHADHPDRRKMQTVFYETLLALVKLSAPILPHTADELWSHLTFVEEQSVQLTDMPETIAVPNSEATEEKFDRFMALRDDVLKALETARNEKIIGKSLEANLKLYPNKENKELLASIKENLSQLFIVSELTISEENEAPNDAQSFATGKIAVEKAEGEMCERSRVISKDVGANPKYPTLSLRNAEIVEKYYQK
nr:isoleucine--tRNA ligase [Bacillus subtilis]